MSNQWGPPGDQELFDHFKTVTDLYNSILTAIGFPSGLFMISTIKLKPVKMSIFNGEFCIESVPDPLCWKQVLLIIKQGCAFYSLQCNPPLMTQLANNDRICQKHIYPSWLNIKFQRLIWQKYKSWNLLKPLFLQLERMRDTNRPFGVKFTPRFSKFYPWKNCSFLLNLNNWNSPTFLFIARCPRCFVKYKVAWVGQTV